MRIQLSLLVVLASMIIVETIPIALATDSFNNTIGRTAGHNLGDSFGRNSTPTTNYGGNAFLNNGFDGVAGALFDSIVKFNINNSIVNKSVFVTDAQLIMTVETTSVTPNINITIWGTNNQTWEESIVTWNMIKNIIASSSNNLQLLNFSTQNIPLDNQIIYFNITEWFNQKKYQDLINLSFIINQSNVDWGADNHYWSFHSKEGAQSKYWPLMNMTYFYSTVILDNRFEPQVLETKNFTYNFSIYDNSSLLTSSDIGVALYLNGTNVGYTYLVHSGNYWNYSYVGPPGLLQANLNITNITVNWTYTIGGTLFNSTKQQTLNRLRIQPCAAPMNNETVKFSIYDEDDLSTRVKATTFDSVFVVWVDSGYRNYSFSNGSYADFNFCIFPGYASANANISVQYSNTSYSTRNYFSQNQPISNTTSLINLYLIATTNSTNIFFTVYNDLKVPQADVIVKALRFYPSTGTFITVAYGKTGYDGMVMIPMELYQYYQYVLSLSGATVSSTSSSQLSSVTQNLYITSGNYVGLFNFVNSVTGVCVANNATKVLSCTINDNSGLMSSATLTVRRWLPANLTTTVCSQTGTTSAMVLSCNLTLYNESNLDYKLVGNFDGSQTSSYILSSGNIDWASPFIQMGYTGVFLAFILVITLFFAGMTSDPSTGIALGSIGLIIASLTGMIQLGWGNLLPLLLVGVIIVYKLSDD